jgi:septal ring factor EnvC (AmiA/AmiB activator)
MNNEEKILKILADMQATMATKADVERVEKTQQEHGEKLDSLLGEVARTRSAVKILDGKIDETKIEVDEIKKRQRPRHAD